MMEKLNFKVYLLKNICLATDLHTFSIMLSVKAKIEKIEEPLKRWNRYTMD